MSQQINLLDQKSTSVGSALAALAALALLLLGLIAYGAVLRAQTVRLQQDADSGQRQVLQAKSELQAIRQRADANNDAMVLRAEIDALKLKSDAIKQWGEQINNGSLGSPDGYAQHLSALASVSVEGLWITSVSIGNAGKLLSLSGRALHNESVLRYANRLNAAFASMGVQFNSVEMTPESLAKTGEPDKAQLTTVAFRLF